MIKCSLGWLILINKSEFLAIESQLLQVFLRIEESLFRNNMNGSNPKMYHFAMHPKS